MIQFLHTVVMDLIFTLVFFILLIGLPASILLIHHLLTYRKPVVYDVRDMGGDSDGDRLSYIGGN